MAYAAPHSPFDPHIIPILRDWLADNFAARFAASLPAVASTLRSRCAAEAQRGVDAATVLRNTDGLFRCSLAVLQETVSEQMRSRFDIRLDPSGDWFNVTARLRTRAPCLLEGQAREEAAIAACAHAIAELCAGEVETLTRSLGALAGRDLRGMRNPVAPRLFVRTLTDTLAALGCDAPARLAVLVACEPVLRKFLPPLYASANAMLRERGVAATAAPPQ